MNIFKRFTSEREPTDAEKADALAFKNKLKYGEDIKGRWDAACQKSSEAYTEKELVAKKLEEMFNFKKRKTYDNWTSFNVSIFNKCPKSPIKQCLYISYYGDKNPQKDDPTICICCDKELF